MGNNLFILLGVSALLTFGSCATETPIKAVEKASISSSLNHVHQLNLKNKSVVLLDVRTPEEFAEGHIDGAVNIDVKADDFESKLEALDKNKTYFIYCRSGVRALNATEKMRSAGFKDAVNFKDGMMTYKGETTK